MAIFNSYDSLAEGTGYKFVNIVSLMGDQMGY